MSPFFMIERNYLQIWNQHVEKPTCSKCHGNLIRFTKCTLLVRFQLRKKKTEVKMEVTIRLAILKYQISFKLDLYLKSRVNRKRGLTVFYDRRELISDLQSARQKTFMYKIS